jgi:predicted dehydrogenase
MTPIRLIQVGLGGWGRDWARLLTRNADLAQTVAHVDMQPAMLQQLQADNGTAAELCFPSLEAALATCEADAVLVTTALGGHIPVALAALEAGKHVLVEKPFAPSLADARRAVDLAAERGLVLMVSQNYRFFPAAQTAAALVRSGALGAVGGASVQFRKYANTEPRDTHWHYKLRQPLLEDMAIHHYDLMRFVLGQEPVSVSCAAWNPPWSHFQEPAAAAATISFDGGAVVDYRGSWVSTGAPTTWSGEWQIECADGIIAWTGRDDRGAGADAVTVRPRGKRARRVELPALERIDRAGSLAAFVQAIAANAEPTASGRDNMGSLALMFATVEAASTGRPQSVRQALVEALA